MRSWYKIEDRAKVGTMGIQHRLVRCDETGNPGPWSDTKSGAWKSYKIMRKQEEEKRKARSER